MDTRSEIEHDRPPAHHIIKLYVKRVGDIESLILIARIYSTDIDMSFGTDKCSRMISKTVNMITTDGVELPEGNVVDVQDSYKYLGIPLANGSHEEAAMK